MSRLLPFLFIFFTLTIHAQRIFTANGALLSFLNYGINSPTTKGSAYRGALVQPSVSLGFETTTWKRFSLTVSAANFKSGGKNPSIKNSYFMTGERITFNNTTLGIVANYYIAHKNTQFYIGIGPRVDYVKPDSDLSYSQSYYSLNQRYFNQLNAGLTGNIGVNKQLNDFYFGVRFNYYYRFGYLYHSPFSPRYISDKLFDLQLIFGYQFPKKEKNR